jgi:hypothetical protein
MIRVKAAFFSCTPPAPPDDDGSYLRWHLLDHMPEQYQLPGIQLALRYIADGAYPEHRLAGSGPLADLGNVVNYLVGDPVQQTHEDFMALGPRLREMGRFPVMRPSLQVRMPALQRWYVSPRVQVSAEVVPWRPHRGVVFLVEEPTAARPDPWLEWVHAEHVPAVLDVPGVAGVWAYGETRTWTLHRNCQGDPQYTTVVYCDDDPLAVAAALTPLLEQRWATGAVRPLFAGPLRTMVQWEAWP